MYKLLILSLFILSVGCEKDNEFGYPAGIRVSDMETENVCSLDECSDKRVRRLIANRVEGIISEEPSSPYNYYFIRYPLSYDSYMMLYICDLSDEFKVDGLKVSFSGDLLDACGVWENIHPFEENYFLKINKINKL